MDSKPPDFWVVLTAVVTMLGAGLVIAVPDEKFVGWALVGLALVVFIPYTVLYGRWKLGGRRRRRRGYVGRTIPPPTTPRLTEGVFGPPPGGSPGWLPKRLTQRVAADSNDIPSDARPGEDPVEWLRRKHEEIDAERARWRSQPTEAAESPASRAERDLHEKALSEAAPYISGTVNGYPTYNCPHCDKGDPGPERILRHVRSTHPVAPVPLSSDVARHVKGSMSERMEVRAQVEAYDEERLGDPPGLLGFSDAARRAHAEMMCDQRADLIRRADEIFTRLESVKARRGTGGPEADELHLAVSRWTRAADNYAQTWWQKSSDEVSREVSNLPNGPTIVLPPVWRVRLMRSILWRRTWIERHGAAECST